MAFSDNTDIAFYNAPLSGTLPGTAYYPPYNTIIQLLTTRYSAGVYHLYSGEHMLFRIVSPVVMTQFRITSNTATPAVQLVTTTNGNLGLYSYAYGDVYRSSVVNLGGGQYMVDWAFSELSVAAFAVGLGGGGYPNESPTVIYKIEASAPFLAALFWTNFNGESEAS
jgi:hypothetical protein